MTQRATAHEQKQARRAVILKAAIELYRAGDGSLPTASQIAAAAGLAKGTVYLYFQTKEEIFAALLLQGWVTVLEMVEADFQADEVAEGDRIEAFLDNLTEHLSWSRELLRLDAFGSGVLEKNMTVAALRQFKQEFNDHLSQAGSSIDRALRLPEGRGIVVLMRTYALIRGLWQSAQHEAPMTDGPDPAWKLTPETYFRELREALGEYWRGALA